jgi:bifunctional N-acetylglutamate synthase/kinase
LLRGLGKVKKADDTHSFFSAFRPPQLFYPSIRAGLSVKTKTQSRDSSNITTSYSQTLNNEASSSTATSLPVARADRTLFTQLLSHFKQTAEVRQYLRHYGRVHGDRFAVVKLSGDVLSSDGEISKVASSLSFLYKMGLVPIVVHGAGLFSGHRPQPVKEATASAELNSSEGVSVDPPSIAVRAASEHMAQANARLVEALRREGVMAEPFIDSIFQATPDTSYEGEFSGTNAVGRIVSVDTKALTEAVKAHRIPIVAALAQSDVGISTSQQRFTFPTQDAAMALAEVIQPLKVIWLRNEGGLRTDTGDLVPSIDLCRDAPHLVTSSFAEQGEGGDVKTLDEEEVGRNVEACVDDLDLRPRDASCLADLSSFYSILREPGATVSVTTPEFLAQELFTHRGAGTLITRGERVFAHSNLKTVDLPRLYNLLGAAFGAPLPVNYLESLAASGRLKRIYVTEEYRGAAVLLHAEAQLMSPSVSYLDKFAVDPSAQGDKLGEVLWKAMVQRERKLFWRSRSSNRVNSWYFSQSDGCFKSTANENNHRDGAAKGDWTVFWRSLDDGEVMTAVSQALSYPPTFPPQKIQQSDDGPPNSLTMLPTLK